MKQCIVGLIINNIAIIKVGRTKSLYNVIRAVLGKRFCNLRIRPIVSFILHSTVSRCFSKDNRVSRMIPRCFWDVVCIIIIKCQWGMRYCSRFPTENKVLCLFLRIWVETHFLLKRPSIYLCQVAIQFKSRGIAIMYHRKQGRIISKKLSI